MEVKEVKNIVRENYARVANSGPGCCNPQSCCCSQQASEDEVSLNIGYSYEDIAKVPAGSNLGLGCGNPVATASIKEGETVLDLGSGAGFDCFLAAEEVGSKGKVIGVDMTPEMIRKAKENALKSKYKNVEFKLGEIENLPVGNNSIDLVISNCVVNLSPDKYRVFTEVYRVLKPGGRLMVSDIVLLKNLPGFIKDDKKAYAGCIAGAAIKEDYLNSIKRAGFKNINVIEENKFPVKYIISDNLKKTFKDKLSNYEKQHGKLEDSILSIKVSAIK